MLQLDVVLLPLLVPVRAFSHRVLFVCYSSAVLNSQTANVPLLHAWKSFNVSKMVDR